MLKKQSTKKEIQLLSIAFATVIVLMFLMIYIGLNHIKKIEQQLTQIVTVHNEKLEIIHRLRWAARERTLSLHRFILLDDPFERDEEWMYYNKQGADFANERTKLMSMQLSADELAILQVQASYTGPTVNAQNQVAQLALNDEVDAAKVLLYEEAHPAQSKVLNELAKFYELQERYIEKASFEADQSIENSKRTIFLLGGLALLLSLVIAVIIIKYINRYQQNLHREKVLAQITLHSIADGVITTSSNGTIEYLNPGAEKMTEWTSEDASGKLLTEVFNIRNESDHCRSPNPLQKTIQQKQVTSSSGNIYLLSASEQQYGIEYTAAPILDARDKLIGTIVVFHDVSEMRTLSQQLSYQASHDALTGLKNRRAFESSLKKMLENCQETNAQHVLCFMDLDRFKIVNDTAGHAAGDELLKQLSMLIQQHTRDYDVVARLGGDEFAIIYRNCSIEKARELTEKIKDNIRAKRFAWENRSYEVGASIGLVPICNKSNSLYNLLSLADSACYMAKNQGRNRVYVYSENDQILADNTNAANWIERINTALNKNYFVLYVQKIQPLKNKSLHHDLDCHYEVLLRLSDQQNKLIPPMAFIPTAERYELMPAIDTWVINNLLYAIKEHQNDNAFIYTINVSGQSLGNEDFNHFLIDQIKNCPISPKQLCFEITETAAIANMNQANALIAILREYGVSFALDDFGSGMSSFGYLKNFAVDYIKIDGSFIRDIVDDPMDELLVKSMNQMGQLLNIKTIAEFVENDEILQLLDEIGIDYVQGYGIERPKPLLEHFKTTKNG